jgi:hypothetical protein
MVNKPCMIKQLLLTCNGLVTISMKPSILDELALLTPMAMAGVNSMVRNCLTTRFAPMAGLTGKLPWKSWLLLVKRSASRSQPYFPEWGVYQTVFTEGDQEEYDIFMVWSNGAGPTNPWGRVRQLMSSEFAGTDRATGTATGVVMSILASMRSSLKSPKRPIRIG